MMADKMSAKSKEQKSPSFASRVISGSVGSIATALAVTPMDVVKVRFQTLPTSAAAGPQLPSNAIPCPRGCGTFILNNGLSECVLPKSAVPYFDRFGRIKNVTNGTGSSVVATVSKATPGRNLGTFAMLRKIFVKEGFQGIYAGLAPTLVMSVPNTVLYFTAYDEMVARFREIEPDRNPTDPAWIPLVAGASARLLATFVTSPLELIRTRHAAMVGSSQSAPTLWTELTNIVSQEGVGGLYKGLTPTLLRDVPFSAIYWFCLERFRSYWRQNSTLPPSPLEQAGHEFVNGAVAGMIAAAFTTPFDVVKTRRQMEEVASESVANQELTRICKHDGATAYRVAHGASPPNSTLPIMRGIVENEGISALWRGNQARMIKVAPACAIMISCYEFGKRVLE